MSLLDNQTKINANTSFFAPAASGGGGGGSSLLPSSLTIGPNATSTSQIVIYGDADEKVKIVTSSNTAVIQHTNAAGANDTPYIGFGNGNLNIRDPSDNLMINFSSIAQGVDFRMGINMSNNTISLDQNKLAGLYYNASNANVYLTGVSTHQINIGTQSNTTQLSVEDNQVSILNNLQVSSINGGAVGGGTTSVGLSNFTGNSATIPSGSLAYPLSATFSVLSNHTYRISQNVALSNGDATGYTTIGLSGGGLAGLPIFLQTWKNVDLIPGLNGGCSGIATTVTASANGSMQVVAYNRSGASNTLVEVQADGAGGGCKWTLEDLGVGL